MFRDGETQSCGCCDLSLGPSETETQADYQQAANATVSCENCLSNAGNPNDPQLMDNSYIRYDHESPTAAAPAPATAPVWDGTTIGSPAESPPSAYAWGLPGQQCPFYPSGSTDQPRTYGSPIIGRQQRPTILVIVVNKPMEGQPHVYPAPNYQATTAAYPVTSNPYGYYNAAARAPLGNYQTGGGASQDKNADSLDIQVHYDNAQNQTNPDGFNNNEYKLTSEPTIGTGSDSRQDRKRKLDCVCEDDDFAECVGECNEYNCETSTTCPESAASNDCICECPCELGDLENTLQGLIPGKDCFCYLAKSRKKKKKRKQPRVIYDRFASPPFVIEPKAAYCSCCCRNRSCCHSCCSPCYSW